MASSNPTMSASAAKPKKKTLSLKVKLELLEEYEKGTNGRLLMEKYNLKKSTFYDIIHAKEKVRSMAKKIAVGGTKEKVFRERKLPFEGLDDATFTWYTQQRAEGVPVRGTDIQAAAERLAVHLGHNDFKASSGWLHRFRNRHGIVNKAITGELLSADREAVEPFVEKLRKIIEENRLHLFQVYNGDETGCFWRSLPRNTQAHITIQSTPGHKQMKDRISILCCANADGSHRLPPAVVGKAKKPRSMKNVMNSLPVDYFDNPSAWFSQDIFSRWFDEVFCPAVRKFQYRTYGISDKDVKAVLLLDNAPAHPANDVLVSHDGNIKAIFLPPNTTSLIQPMDQGIIESCKRLYKKKYLRQCLVVVEEGMDDPDYVDSRGRKTLDNFKRYSIKDAIFNWAEAWKEVPLSTLKNGWTKVLQVPRCVGDFEGFEPHDYNQLLQAADQGNLANEEVEEWLNDDANLPGYHHLTEEEIAAEVSYPAGQQEEAEEEAEEETGTPGPSLPSVIDATDHLLRFMDHRDGAVFGAKYYVFLRELRQDVQKALMEKKKQRKISDFFKPAGRRRTSSASRTSESVAGSSRTPTPASSTRRVSESGTESELSLPSVASSSSLHIVTPDIPEILLEGDDDDDMV